MGLSAPVWFTIAAALLSIHLLRLWVARAFASSPTDDRLLIVPVVLLAIEAIPVIAARRLTWGDGIMVGLCLLLLGFGLLERRGGIRRLWMPALRLDRL